MARLLMNGILEDLPLHRSLGFMARFLWRTRINPLEMGRGRNLVALDPPRHDEIRGVVNRGFTPGRVSVWEPRIREIAKECLAGLPHGRNFDVVRNLAAPLPTTIIAEMLGIEVERQADFRSWTDTVIHCVSGPGREAPLAHGFLDAVTGLLCYLKQIVAQRRQQPRADLISVILQGHAGSDALTPSEVLQFVVLLLIAGNETTTNLIANSAQALLDHPEILAQLVAEPSKIPLVVEETLRWQAPIQILFRNTTKDVELAGTRIPRGATVAAMIASANRDERRFADGDNFDPWRPDHGHLGFGFGAHFCLGAALARLEARIALEELVPALPSLRAAGGRPPLRNSFLVRGPEAMPLEAIG
ncbi:MAG: cytochrome P450 [bacterium]